MPITLERGGFGRLYTTHGVRVADLIRPHLPSMRFRPADVVRILTPDGEVHGVIVGGDGSGRWRVATKRLGSVLHCDEADLTPSDYSPLTDLAGLPRGLADTFLGVFNWLERAVGDLVDVRHGGQQHRLLVRGIHEGSGDVLLRLRQRPLVVRYGESELDGVMDHHSVKIWRAHLRAKAVRRTAEREREPLDDGTRIICDVVAEMNAALGAAGDGRK